ncbi:proline iminopeptidase [Favolaschia claudopus]|uniref:Proline iminopeptidase n=1 Tax=Favolaschia claudopus TaxID=2862362 RepID=A0AAW0D1J3_9AGAR
MSSTPSKVVEGEVEFIVPAAGKPCKTWYKIIGDLNDNATSTRCPLVALHGGPGVNHAYLLSLSDLIAAHSIPLILYDQLGNGNSTHLPEKMGDTEFWTEQHLRVEEYDLLGHSWGGMLGARHAATQPAGLKHLIIVSSPASMDLWVEAQNILRAKLPQDVQDKLDTNEKDGTTESEEYQSAVAVFYARHLCTLDPMPEPVQEALGWIAKDSTVYLTMNGPSEFYVTGPLKEWSMVEDAHKIRVPTLLMNGRYDEAQDSVMAPFFNRIPYVKWVTFAESSHMVHWEERERFMEVLGSFLLDGEV